MLELEIQLKMESSRTTAFFRDSVVTTSGAESGVGHWENRFCQNKQRHIRRDRWVPVLYEVHSVSITLESSAV